MKLIEGPKEFEKILLATWKFNSPAQTRFRAPTVA